MEVKNKLLTIRLNVYGIFNDYYPTENFATLYLEEKASLSDIKLAFLQDIKRKHHQLTQSALDKISNIIDSSAFSKNNHIVSHFCVLEDAVLAILPPVCGG